MQILTDIISTTPTRSSYAPVGTIWLETRMGIAQAAYAIINLSDLSNTRFTLSDSVRSA